MMTNKILYIRRAILAFCLMVTATTAWAEVSVSNAADLQTALNGAEQDIKLTANITLSTTLTIERNLTLNLNGFNINASGFRAIHVKGGDLTITSPSASNISVGGAIADNSSVIRVGDNSGTARTVKLTIDENISINTDKCYGVTVFGSQTTETLIVNGKVNTTDVPAISGNGSTGYGNTTITIGEKAVITTTNEVAIYHPQSGILTVNGTVTGAGGIEMKGGQLVVGPKAKITATAAPSHAENNDGTSTKGYAIAIVENGQYAGVSTVNVDANASVNGAVAVVKDSDKADPSAPDPDFSGGGMQMKVKVTDSSSQVMGQYLYIEDAMREASAGSTVTLLGDCNVKTTLETTLDFTLDLDGHTLTSSGQGALWIKSGTVTVTSTAGAGQITVPTISDHDAYAIRVGSAETGTASLTVAQSVTIAADECYGISVYGSGTTETLTVNGNVETKIRPAIAGRNEAGTTAITVASTASITTTDEVAIYHPQSGTLTVNGTVSGDGGIEIKGGTLVVDAGARISATGTPTHVANDNRTSSRGYSIAIVENNACAGVTAVTVPDGASITGPMALLQDSKITDFNPTLTGTRLTTVASIEKDKYFTLKDAISIVPASGIVKLLGDLTLDKTLAMDKAKTYTLDLAGHNLTGNDCPAIHVKYGNVTIGNTGGSEKSIGVRSGTPAAVILLGDNTGANRNVSLTINNNVNVNGRTFASGIKLDGSATRESLTVKGKVTTNGHIAILGTKGDTADKIEVANGANVTATGAVAIYHPQSGRLIVGATATVSGSGAIEMKGGDLTVHSGAVITKKAASTAHASREDAPSTDGYAIALVEHSGFSGVGKVNIDNAANITGVIAWLVDSKNTSVAEPAFTGDVIMVAETDNADGLGERYAKISDAIDAAISSNEVRVLEDFAVTSPFTINKNITLNMNDYTITGNQSEAYTITVSKNATIKNGGVISDKGGISVTSGTVNLQDMTVKTVGVSLNVAGGTVTDNSSCSFTSTGNNTINLTAGSLQLSSKVYNSSSIANNNAIAASGTAVLGIASTAIISSANGKGIDWQSGGTLTIQGGKFIGTEAVNASYGTVTIDGGTFTGGGHAVNLGACTPGINGGTFICGSDASYKPIIVTAGSASGFVKGDYFSKAIAQSLCASGYMVSTTPKSNGMFYLVNEIVINDGTNWSGPAERFTIATAKYVRSSGMGAHGTKFGTLCLPFSFAYNVVDGMKFYTVNRIEGEVLYLDEITSGSINAGTPVVFQFTSAQTGFTIVSTNAEIPKADAGTSQSTDNKLQLKGTFTKQEITSELTSIYYLNSDHFHQASQSLTVPAFRAYIKVTPPSSARPRLLRIATDDDMTTAIDATFEDAELESVYDLNGRKHNGLQRGMNIIRHADGSTMKVIVR